MHVLFLFFFVGGNQSRTHATLKTTNMQQATHMHIVSIPIITIEDASTLLRIVFPRDSLQCESLLCHIDTHVHLFFGLFVVSDFLTPILNLRLRCSGAIFAEFGGSFVWILRDVNIQLITNF